MTRLWDDETLRESLRAIGVEDPVRSAAVADAVLGRLAAEPAPTRSVPARLRMRAAEVARWVRARLVRLGAIVAALVFGVAVSPVGAQVADWFEFHGVLVGPERDEPDDSDDSGGGTPTVPPVSGQLTLEQAADLVAFRPGVPADLGMPDAISVSEDRRLLSMSWGRGIGTVRLDQFDGRLAPAFYKGSDDPQPVAVGKADGLWFPTPHEIEVLTGTGPPTTVPSRLAAQTLVWERDGVTFRLEGPFAVGEAIAVAESVR